MRVYVGTYAKYNNGSIAGSWLNLSDYENHEDFMKACSKLHNDEHDPELMNQDWEGVPQGSISECSVDPKLWDLLKIEDYEYYSEKIKYYMEATGVNLEEAITDIIDNGFYYGTFRSTEEFAEDFAINVGYLSEIESSPLSYHIDWESYARNLQASFTFHYNNKKELIVFATNNEGIHYD